MSNKWLENTQKWLDAPKKWERGVEKWRVNILDFDEVFGLEESSGKKFPRISAKQRAKFIVEITKAVQLFKDIEFGTPAGSIPGVEDPTDSYDKDFWYESINDKYRWTDLFLRPEKKPSEALNAIHKSKEKWALDCARFAQIILLFAKMVVIGEKRTNKYYDSVGNGKFNISPHASNFLYETAFISKKIPLKSEPYINGFTGTVFENLTEENLLSDKVQLGSICTFTNQLAPSSSAFRSENSIKVGIDNYVAFGFGNPPENLQYSASEIKRLLALSYDSNLSGEALTSFINSNIFLHQVQFIE